MWMRYATHMNKACHTFDPGIPPLQTETYQKGDSQNGGFPAPQERKKDSDQIKELFFDSYKITVLWIKYMHTHSTIHH